MEGEAVAKEVFVQIKWINMKDKIVESVLDKFKERSKKGIDKYGVTLDREDLSGLEWLTHLQEELMDATLYIERYKKDLEFMQTQPEIFNLYKAIVKDIKEKKDDRKRKKRK